LGEKAGRNEKDNGSGQARKYCGHEFKGDHVREALILSRGWGKLGT